MISFNPHFKEGQELRLEIKRTIEDARRPSQTYSLTPVEVRVLKADAFGYVLDWVYGETSSYNEAPHTAPAIELKTNYGGLHLQVVLSPGGGYQGLENEAEVRIKVRELTDAMIEQALQPFAQDQRKQLAETVRRIALPESETTFFKPIQLFVGSYGLQLEVGMPEQAIVSIPQSPSSRLSTQVNFQVDRLDERGTAHGVIELKYPGTTNGAPTTLERVSFKYGTASGYMENILSERTIGEGQTRRVDRLEITVRPPQR